jgi:signal transduction histidine kinase
VERLASLRVWLLAAMLGTGAVGVALAYVVVGQIEHSREITADRDKARVVARAIAAQMAAGAGPADLSRLQRVLPTDQLIVTSAGAVVFMGRPLLSSAVEVTVTAGFPGGRVTVVDHESVTSGAPTDAVVAGILVAGLVTVAALSVSSLITRSVREPLQRAIEVSDRIAAGDLTARMGAAGPDALSHLGAALDEMAGRLEREDRDRRRFLADVAHEVATPVNTIVSYAQAIADGTVTSAEERERAARAISGAGDRVVRLLAALRELTSLDLYGEVHGEPLDLAEVCGGLVERLRPTAEASGLTLACDVPAVGVSTDRRLVETILDNLLTNAIRYTPAGGSVTVQGRIEPGWVEFAVADTGVGIASEHLPRIFDDLYRTDEARRQQTGGVGLGLSIARRATEVLGGSITVASAPGQGSRFTVRLPRTAGQM